MSKAESKSVDGKDLLLAQIKSLKSRIRAAIKSGSNTLAPSLGVEYIKLTNSSLGIIGNDDRLLREILLLKSEANLYPRTIPKNDPLLQLRWLDSAIPKLETIVRKVPSGTTSPTISKLHPRVVAVSERLLQDGHYSQAIFEAFKALEEYVRDKTSIHDKYGTTLMAHVFKENNPILKVRHSHPQTASEEQEGLKLIFMGAMLAIKNPKSHRTIRLRKKSRALLYLAFASLLFELVNDATLSTS